MSEQFEVVTPEQCAGKTVAEVRIDEFEGEVAVKFTDGTCLVVQSVGGWYGEHSLGFAESRHDVGARYELGI